MPEQKEVELYLTCPKSLEGLLLDEAQSLGLTDAREQLSGVSGRGTLEDAYRMCLWSRLANRVLLVLKRFSVKTVEDLYHGINDLDWSEHLQANGTLSVEFTGRGSGIDNTHFGALKVKDAIVDALRDKEGNRPSVDKISPDVRIHLHLNRGEATLSLDLSGTSLHQRGYRLQQGAAPLKENLAAAILLRAGWPALAKQGAALTDPMCGVGTFLVEGAMMAADIAPNLRRERWGFSNWLGHQPQLWQPLYEEAQQRAEIGLAKPPLWIRGYEGDPRLIQPARNNIERAGLASWINIYQGELATFEPKPDHGQTGLVVTNPPYGERLGDEASLLYLYQYLGERLRSACLGWEAAVFTGAPQLGKRMGLRSHKQYSLFNGALPCRLLLFQVQPERFVLADRVTTHTKPGAAVDYDEAPRLTGEPERESAAPIESARLSEGGQMFANRLQKNFKQLGKWARKEQVECYRLYDADMPEYALAVDIYADWVHVQEYAAPKTIDPEKAKGRFLDALAAIPTVLDVPPERIVIKRRERQAGTRQYERQAERGQFMHISEGGVRNTTSVDLSKTYLDWAKRNLALNGFSDKHSLVHADVMVWLENDRESYDLIFLDPPTFSNSKRMEDVFDIQRDHVLLLDRAMARLASGGSLYFSNNFRRFVMDESIEARYQVTNITDKTFDPDFARNKKIHQAWHLTQRTD